MERRVRNSTWHESQEYGRADVVGEEHVREVLAKDLGRSSITHRATTPMFDDVTPELRNRMVTIAKGSATAGAALEAIIGEILADGNVEKQQAIFSAVQRNVHLLQQWERAFEELRVSTEDIIQ
jgi:hypothetical protein